MLSIRGATSVHLKIALSAGTKFYPLRDIRSGREPFVFVFLTSPTRTIRQRGLYFWAGSSILNLDQ
jgi:hypothetical protein